MKKQLVVVTISTWLMLILIHSTWADVTLDLGSTATGSTYTTTLIALRNQVRDATRGFFGIPMLPRATNPTTFILVELKSSPTTSITLALDRSNLYVVGYADKVNGNVRAHFFTDAPHRDLASVFPTAQGNFRRNLTFGGSYAQLESKAGGGRMKIGLGIQKLKNRVDKVYGAAVNEKTQAEFLLIAVQMVSEATRFIYIENQVRANFNKFEFNPDFKVISLENEWGKISTKIRNANTATGVINPAIEIVDAKNIKVTIAQVSVIKPDIGILNFVA